MSARRAVTALVAGALVAGTTGCSMTLSDLPRPGGSVAGPSYEVTAIFADALNLPDGAQVRIDGVEVGVVTGIRAEDFAARVAMLLPERVVLTDTATAELRLTTPLGEGFIDLDPGSGAGRLGPGAVIEEAATSTTAGVEDLLTAASVLLTGGGLGQITTIVTELNAALDTRRGDAGRLLRSLDEVLSAFNDRTDDIDRTLDALDGLAGTLAARRGTIVDALTDTAPAAQLLADSTAEFTELLGRLAELGRAGDRVVRRARADLVATLRDVEPVLDALISIEGQVGPTLRRLVRFGTFLDDATPGDYLTGDANLSQVSAGGGAGSRTPDLTLRQMMSDRTGERPGAGDRR